MRIKKQDKIILVNKVRKYRFRFRRKKAFKLVTPFYVKFKSIGLLKHKIYVTNSTINNYTYSDICTQSDKVRGKNFHSKISIVNYLYNIITR